MNVEDFTDVAKEEHIGDNIVINNIAKICTSNNGSECWFCGLLGNCCKLNVLNL